MSTVKESETDSGSTKDSKRDVGRARASTMPPGGAAKEPSRLSWLQMSQVINPEYTQVVAKLIRVHGRLGTLSGLDKKPADHDPAKSPEEVRHVVSEAMEDIENVLKSLFYSKTTKMPLSVAIDNLEVNMKTELEKQAAIDDTWAEVVQHIKENYSTRAKVVVGQDTVEVSVDKKERKSHFTTNWAQNNMCQIVQAFSMDRMGGDRIRAILSKVGQWGIDIFELDRVSNHRPLACVAYATFCQHNLFNLFKIPKNVFMNYFTLVENAYQKTNSYHNSIHAADVMQTANAFLSAARLQEFFTDLEVLILLFSCAVHDVDHPGVNNGFLVNIKSPLAAIYNNESVLENHHIKTAFNLIAKENCDIFMNLSKRKRYVIMKYAKETILGTDMAKHNVTMANLQAKLDNFEDIHLGHQRLEIMEVICHTADLSNPTKPPHIYNEWADRVMSEFFRQGDLERSRGLPISMLCDRLKPDLNIPKVQVGFIDFVVGPLYDMWGKFVAPDGKDFMNYLAENRALYVSGEVKHTQFKSAHEREDPHANWFSGQDPQFGSGDWDSGDMEARFYNQYPVQYIWQQWTRWNITMRVFVMSWVVLLLAMGVAMYFKYRDVIECLFPGDSPSSYPKKR